MWGYGLIYIINIRVWPQEVRKDLEKSLDMLSQSGRTADFSIDVSRYAGEPCSELFREKYGGGGGGKE